MHAAKFFSNCLIEIPHEWNLFQGAKVQVHEFPELLAYRRHSVSVAAHIGERDTSDDAARADGHVVNIPATHSLPGRDRVYPSNQIRKFEQTRGSPVASPYF
jgi:hypothetical protein